MHMNESKLRKAFDACSRFHEQHPHLSAAQSLPAIRSIHKRFGVTSEQLIATGTKRREALDAEIAELRGRLATPNHQAAVNSLVELSMTAAGMQGAVSLPFDQVPGLFRAVIESGNAAGRSNRHACETDLIGHALMLIDRNGGDATIRTPELEQFYADLAMSFDEDGQVRVSYSPSNVTIH